MSTDQWQWYRIIYVTDLKKGFVVIVVIDVRIFTASRFLANIKSWLLCFPILIEKWHFLGKGWLTLDFTICWFIGNWLLGEYWVTYDDWSLVETNVFAASSSPASHTSCLWVILSLICFAMPCENKMINFMFFLGLVSERMIDERNTKMNFVEFVGVRIFTACWSLQQLNTWHGIFNI